MDNAFIISFIPVFIPKCMCSCVATNLFPFNSHRVDNICSIWSIFMVLHSSCSYLQLAKLWLSAGFMVIDAYHNCFINGSLILMSILNVISGVNRLCRDIEFMINIKPGFYWRICWAILTPFLMIIILIYTFLNYKPLTYKDQPYPDWAICKCTLHVKKMWLLII